jgi:hypothetical protein
MWVGCKDCGWSQPQKGERGHYAEVIGTSYPSWESHTAWKQATWRHESSVSSYIFGECRDWTRERLALLRENPPSWLVLWWYCFCNELVHVLNFLLRYWCSLSWFPFHNFFSVGWGSSVGIVTCYGLDDWGIEFHWGVRFSAPVQTRPWAHPAFYTMGTRSFPGVRRLGCGDHLPPSSARFKERVELYLYSTSGPLWPVTGWTLPYLTIS